MLNCYLKFFDRVPYWSDLKSWQKLGLMCGDLIYAGFTLGLPISATVLYKNIIPFVAIVYMEMRLSIPPLVPFGITLCSISKSCWDNRENPGLLQNSPRAVL